MSTERRRMMMQKGGIECPYIKDGLALWLDGIEKGATNGNWVDLIQGIEFVNSGYAQSVQDGFYFSNAKNAWLSAPADGTLFPSDTSTIEVCFEALQANTYMTIFSPRATGYINAGIRVSGGNYCSYTSLGSSVPATAYKYSVPTLFACRTLSMNADKAMANFIEYQKSGTGGFSEGSNSGTFIGKRANRVGTGFFYGYIRSIRIYSRHLTLAEMLFNQQIDNTRFNLGL